MSQDQQGALLDGRHLTPEETCQDLLEEFPGMLRACWDIRIGAGWMTIVRSALQSVKAVQLGGEFEMVTVVQIKEKFGKLRIHHGGGNEITLGIIRAFENLSIHVCEACGTTVNVHPTGAQWIKSLCASCSNQWDLGVLTWPE